MRSRRVAVATALALLLGLLVRALVAAAGRDLPEDGVFDLEIARHLVLGEWQEALRLRYHPLPGALAALVATLLGRTPDERCGQIVVLLVGSLVPPLAALAAAALASCGNEAGGRTTSGQVPAPPAGGRPARRAPASLDPAAAALAAGLLAATHPYLARASATVFNYPIAHAAAALAVLALARLALRGSPVSALAAGAAAGLGYLARPDGLCLFAGTVVGALVAGAFAAPGARAPRSRASAAAALLSVVGFAALAAPFILGLRAATGELRLTLKKDERHLVGLVDPNAPPPLPPGDDELRTLIDRVERPQTSTTPVHSAGSGRPAALEAVGLALQRTGDGVLPPILLLVPLGLIAAARRRALPATLPSLFVVGAFLAAHALLRRHEGYLSRLHAVGEAGVLAPLAGLGLAAFAPRDRRGRGLAFVLAGTVLVPKALDPRTAARDDLVRRVAARLESARRSDGPWVVCGRGSRPAAFLAGARHVELPRGDAATVVSSARAAGAAALALFVRERTPGGPDGAPATPGALVRIERGLEAAGLPAPERFSGKREGPDGERIHYTWLLYDLTERSPR